MTYAQRKVPTLHGLCLSLSCNCQLGKFEIHFASGQLFRILYVVEVLAFIYYTDFLVSARLINQQI